MDRGHWANLVRMPGLHPYSFKSHPGIFCLIRRTVLFDSIVSPSLYWCIRTHTDHRVSAGLTNTSSSSNLTFSEGLPSRY